jgi:hypothetical protein
VLACGAWEGKPKYIHENEAIFDEATSTYFERRCYAWNLASNPRHTTVCLRFATHKVHRIRWEVPLCGETRPRRDLEPKSYF